jgi:hypothetical protein
VIRRAFWLVLGAALGVSGYRRVSRLAQSLFPAGVPGARTVGGHGSLRAGPAGPGPTEPGPVEPGRIGPGTVEPGVAGGGAAGPGAAGRGAPAAVRVAARPSLLTGRSVLAGAARAGRSAARGAAFARDVRDGMAEYRDRQRLDQPGLDQQGRGRRTLESQRGQRAPGRQRRSAAP